MANIVHVLSNHPLSPSHCFSGGLRLKDLEIQSIIQGFHYVRFLHFGMPAAAEHILDDPAMKWQPERIAPYAAKEVGDRLNANFDFKADEIFRAIIFHQMVEGNPLYDAFCRELQGLKDPKLAEFRVYTGQTEEVFTSGCKYGSWVSLCPGSNVFAGILKEVADLIACRAPIENSLFDELLTNFKLFHPVLKKSVLVVIDSQGACVTQIAGGDIVPIGGGRYAHLARVLSSEKYRNLSEYGYIVVSCGFNCTQEVADYPEHKARKEFLQLKEILVREAAIRDKPSVLFACAFDHPLLTRNPAHVAWIKEQLRGTGVICQSWEVDNPFLVNRKLNKELFVVNPRLNKVKDDEVHVNRRGFRLMWRSWCREFPHLRLISYHFGPDRLSMRKSAFPCVEPGQVQPMAGLKPVPNLQVTLDVPGNGKIRNPPRSKEDRRPSTVASGVGRPGTSATSPGRRRGDRVRSPSPEVTFFRRAPIRSRSRSPAAKRQRGPAKIHSASHGYASDRQHGSARDPASRRPSPDRRWIHRRAMDNGHYAGNRRY